MLARTFDPTNREAGPKAGLSMRWRAPLALLAADLDQVGGPLGWTPIDLCRAPMPAARAGDRLVAVLVLVDDVLEGLGSGRCLGCWAGIQACNSHRQTLPCTWGFGEQQLCPKSADPAGISRRQAKGRRAAHPRS